MLVNEKYCFYVLFIAFTLYSSSVKAEGDEPQGLAVNILSQLQDNSHVHYVNAENWLVDEDQKINNDTLFSLTQIKTKVLKYNKPTLVDFSSITDESEKELAKELFRKQIGISFPNDLLIITKHKGELMFASIEDDEDPSIALLESDTNKVSDVDLKNKIRETVSTSEHDALPHLSFYLMVNRRIMPMECTFKASTIWSRFGDRIFCEDSSISLIYKINLQRSLAYGNDGNETPDIKVVRISLDDDSSGAGIHLNDDLSYQEYLVPYLVWVGDVAEWNTSAIAQDYSFSIDALNGKAAILRTVPRNNLNADYEKQETSGFTLGVAVGAEADMSGPKVKSEASASYTQTRSLTFKTQDYRVEKSTIGSRKVTFRWVRQQYSTAQSLQNRFSDAIWAMHYPVDLTRINPISYKNFVPKMDVIYKAPPYTVGVTDFSIRSSVNIRPLYHKAYQYYYLFGAHHEYFGIENSKRRRVEKVSRFTVDWKHPVFIGGRLVDLQLGSFNDRCIESSTTGRISTSEKCIEDKVSQSFIYDKHNRYVSASNTKLCLDGQSLSQLKACDMSLSQRWLWVKDTDKLSNVYDGRFLGHNKSTGQLGLYTEGSDQISLRTLTDYTNFLKRRAYP
ncbi:leukocidin family pore-forming toxin [Photobacterium leiognathi subsp. mandapamensis]|uniref:leukocidin family pore-forming toxin n=1 Tax=Photobacterium leiognathi TaxID=553611 RepID=UPI003BF46673